MSSQLMQCSPDLSNAASEAAAVRDGVLPGLPQRELELLSSGIPGPTTILLAAMHGNEPAGVIAARQVLQALRSLKNPIRGRVHLIIGNRVAYASNVRFVESDLNRAFPLPPAPAPDDARLGRAESLERTELLRCLRGIVAQRDPGHDVIAIDLHTFSSDGPPFAVFADTIRNRRFALCWPVPCILGLVESLPGTLSEHLAEAGCISAVFEGGRHDDPRSVDRIAAAIRLALVRAGHVDEEEISELAEDRRMLSVVSRGVPSVLDIRHRHGVARDDAFRMRPGYRNFQRVRSGERLADDRHGGVTARTDGLILLPLYQAQGDDGFFLARSIGRFWLFVSTVLRAARISAVIHLLPGVSRHPRHPRTIEVNPRVARFLAGDILHALGYRSIRSSGEKLVLMRRRHDFKGPRTIRI